MWWLNIYGLIEIMVLVSWWEGSFSDLDLLYSWILLIGVVLFNSVFWVFDVVL